MKIKITAKLKSTGQEVDCSNCMLDSKGNFLFYEDFELSEPQNQYYDITIEFYNDSVKPVKLIQISVPNGAMHTENI